ncbi:MAG: hypothetical protein ABMA64_21285 [Myxococcota bacterium]
MEAFADTSALFAVAGHRDAAALTALGLHAQQHRGTAGAGIASADGALVRLDVQDGPAHASFGAERLEGLPGALAIGQVFGRSPLEGPSDDGELYRIAWGRFRGGPMAAAVSGQVVNGSRLRRELADGGSLFRTASDAELLLHLIATSNQRTVVNRVVDAIWRIRGAYALVVLTEDHLIAVRDPAGFRPLVLGRLGDAQLFATEDAAIRFVGGEVRREVRPGELLVADARGMVSVSPLPTAQPRACAQELATLARSDATVFGRSTHAVRSALGERLGQVHPCPEADLVCGALGGGVAARAYARVAGLPYEDAVVTEAPVARPLPEPPSGVPGLTARARWRVVPAVVADRTVVVVTPVVSTGREVRQVVRLLIEAGARDVHLRVASAPVLGACPYGVASPLPEELVSRSAADPAELLGVRSVAWLPREAAHELVNPHVPELDGLCEACLGAPPPLVADPADDQLPLF